MKKRDSSKENVSEVREPIYGDWASRTFWTIEESALLLQGVDPADVNKMSDEALSALTLLKRAINHAQENDQLPKEIRPVQVVDWVDRVFKIGAPPKLRKAVKEYAEDPERSFAQLSRKFAQLKREHDVLLKEQRASKKLDPRERRTLSELVIVMAMKHYKYDGRRGPAVKQILADLKEYGLARSDDVVRDTLKEAITFVPESYVPREFDLETN